MNTKSKSQNSELSNRIAPTSGQQATKTQQPEQANRAVFFDGPFSKQDPKGERDETPYWTVYVGFDWCSPVRTVYQVNSFKRAESLAQAMAHDRKLELVAEALPA